MASVISLLIGYPAAYFVARFAGRRKALFLVLLIAPFWISYMMRMLAWIDLLQTDGYVNKVLSTLHLISHPVDWLGGQSYTVILGLVYGYIPYLILVLYAGLDRIDGSLLEAGRDLGLGRLRTFLRVTLPLSRQAILTGLLITVLPMLGDYFTNQLLSGTAGTAMIGNVIDGQPVDAGLRGPGRGRCPCCCSLLLVVPMIYYVVATNRSSREAVMSATAATPVAAAGRHRGGQGTAAAAAAQPVGPPLVPRGIHLALPDLVDRADRARRPVLLQQRQVAERLAGLLHALVLLRPGELRPARRAAAAGGHPDAAAVGLHHADRRPAGRGVRDRHQPVAQLHARRASTS